MIIDAVLKLFRISCHILEEFHFFHPGHLFSHVIVFTLWKWCSHVLGIHRDQCMGTAEAGTCTNKHKYNKKMRDDVFQPLTQVHPLFDLRYNFGIMTILFLKM